ncbi:MAG: hypothetical protein ACRC9X_00480, partial [Bacteroidales bacterium]
NAFSIVEGICPKGWIFPGRKDWGVMFNKVAKCSDALAETVVSGPTEENAPCFHLGNAAAGDVSLNTSIATIVATTLRSTLSSRATTPDSIFVTATNPVWPWSAVGTKRSHGSRPIDYYGFSALPTTILWRSNFYAWERFANASSTAPNTGDIERIHGYYDKSTILMAGGAYSNLSGAFLRCAREYNLDR